MDRSQEGHTVQRYDGELNYLHYLVLEMGGLVVFQVRSAVNAFDTGDTASAKRVIDRDREVDHLEVKADELISSIIARRAPVANDLRLVICASKSVAELERIGDEAAKIAGLVSFAQGDGAPVETRGRLGRDVVRMAEQALESLKSALKVFDVWDERTADQVLVNHRSMEQAFEATLRRLASRDLDDSGEVTAAISLVLLSKALEHISHHTWNLTEHVMLQNKSPVHRDRNA